MSEVGNGRVRQLRRGVPSTSLQDADTIEADSEVVIGARTRDVAGSGDAEHDVGSPSSAVRGQVGDELVAGENEDQHWWRNHVVAAVVLPLALFLLLRPESYGLAPNRLDPFFYTGYAINFDDIMREIGDNHYFVTRWTAYLPSRIASDWMGPIVGRLVLRWATGAAVLLGLWHVGRRWRWTRPAELVIGVVVMTMPMFARAFLTDYIEWVVVAGGLALIPQCLEPRRSVARSAIIGTVTAAMLIANPVAATICGPPVLVYLWLSSRPARRVTVDAAVIATSAAAVVVAGVVVFRWRYGIGDVYEPTLEFIETRSNGRDPWKSPRMSWMFSYVWIYIPAIALVIGWFPQAVRRRFLALPGAVPASLILLAQYAFQGLDQFVRGGTGIEISYYWVFVYPGLAVFMSIMIGLFTWRWSHATSFVLIWIGLLVQARVVDVRLPGGWVVFGVLVPVAVALVLVATRRPAWSVAALTAFALALQLNAPTYDPSGYYGVNSDPHYDEIFFNPRSDAMLALDEAIWLEDRLDTLPEDEGLFFVADAFADAIIGIYGPHVTGHWLTIGPDGSLSDVAQRSISDGSVDQIAVYGSPAFVASVLAELSPWTRGILLEEHHGGGFGFDLSVVELRTPAEDPYVWEAADLLSATGSVDDGSRRGTPQVDPPGHLVFGPYVPLDGRDYRMTVEYRSDERVGLDAGLVDVSRLQVSDGELVGAGTVVAGPIGGTDGALATFTLDFVGTRSDLWEFRVWWDGERQLTVERITLEPLL